MNRFHFIIASLSLFFLLELSTKVAAANKDILKFLARIGSKLTKKNKMGQAVRMIQYDRAANERNAIPALKLASHDLRWYKLDDPVMGGQSETNHTVEKDYLNFQGVINTNGGGFASIRSAIPQEVDLLSGRGLLLRVTGDGKTYKFFLTDGSRGGPMSRNPSWQMDIPTNGEWQQVEIPFDKLLPSFGPRTPSDISQYKFDAKEMREIGLMLSLKLADGSANPKETFGEGVFPFSLLVDSIDVLN